MTDPKADPPSEPEAEAPPEPFQQPQPQPDPPPPPPPPAAPGPRAAVVARPPARYTPQRLLVFFGILVAVAMSYLVVSEVVYHWAVRRLARYLVAGAIHAEIRHIGRLDISREGEIVLHNAQAEIDGADGPKLFYSAEQMSFAIEGDILEFVERGTDAVDTLKLRRVDLIRPHLYFRRASDGVWNVDLAFSSVKSGPARPLAPTEELPDYFPREGIHVQDATIHSVFFSQKGLELDWIVEHVDMRITKTPSGHLELRNPEGEPVLEGSFYEGKLRTHLELLDYRRMVEGNLQIFVVDANLAKLTRNVDLERRVAGRLSASISLGRTYTETRGQLRGSGRILIKNGDLYDYPMVVAALSVLSFANPSDNRIREANAAFSLESDRIRIEQIDFIGTSMSLYGSGECDLQGDNLYVVLAPRLPGTFNPLNLALGIMGTALLEGSVVEPVANYTTLAPIEPSIRRLVEERATKGNDE